MILLEKNKYFLCEKALESVQINHFFAMSVIRNHVNGQVFVNHANNPKVFYVKHPYGMSLLFGKTDDENFNNWLKKYISDEKTNHEYLQASPDSWDKIFQVWFSNIWSETENKQKIWLQTRANFEFFPNEFHKYFPETGSHEIVKIDKEIFESFEGSVVPKVFWNNAEDFLQKGIGYCLIVKGKPASIAFSSFVHEPFYEIGIETTEEFRGNGLAKIVCSELINFLQRNRFNPVWSCRKGNSQSYYLAQKLGFKPSFEIPYYIL